MAQNIINLMYNDLDLVDNLLVRWGRWLQSESHVANLGFSNTTSFLKQASTKNSYTTITNENQDHLSELIYNYLLKNPLFLKIAKISYVYCRDCSALEKSNMLIHNDYNLGTKPETIRKKYKELENYLKYYIQGVIHYHEQQDTY